MDLSKSETSTLCLRYFSAVNLPPGADAEVAESVVWLASHGYPVLENLTQSVQEFNSFQSIWTQLERESELGAVDVGELFCGAWVAIADWLIARCAKSQSREIQVRFRNVKDSYFFLPLLLGRSSQGFEFEIESTICQAVFSRGKFWTNTATDQMSFVGHTDTVSIRCARVYGSDQSESPQYFVVRSDMHLFGERPNEKERARIELADEVYWKLKKVAAKCFVPASDQSRQRGAGAEVDDSD